MAFVRVVLPAPDTPHVMRTTGRVSALLRFSLGSSRASVCWTFVVTDVGSVAILADVEVDKEGEIGFCVADLLEAPLRMTLRDLEKLCSLFSGQWRERHLVGAATTRRSSVRLTYRSCPVIL